MNPQDLPLEPLIPPTPISWWPLAPIWWVLIAFFIIVFIIKLISYLKKKLSKNKPVIYPIISTDIQREAALNELKIFDKPYNKSAGPWLQEVNGLLKRVCNISYPNDKSKTLLGNAWLQYLNEKCPEAHLKQFPALIDGEYKANYMMDNKAIDDLHLAIENWINHHV